MVARPQASDAAVKTPRPVMSRRRRPKQVSGPTAEQEEAPEGQPVGGDHPLQV